MRIDDLIITIAYFSIPFQILASLYQYPRLAVMPLKLQVLVVLFALFIFLCGAGHALRCMEMTNKYAFEVVNFFTAVVSLVTCLYLLPLVPSVMSTLDESLQSLKHLNEELESSKRKLMTFMAFLCHEIRNPLFVITSNLSFLEEDQPHQVTEESEQALQAISQSVDLMLRLVNDVLDISKLESGKLALQEHDFDLRETLEGVVSSTDRVVTQLHKGAVQFRKHIADNVPHSVRGDSVRLLQIVFNLLSNANKFTEAGHIDFSVSLVHPQEAIDKNLLTRVEFAKSASTVSTDDNSSESETHEGDFALNLLDAAEQGRIKTERPVILRIRVEDTGSGIPSEHMQRLFQPYSQSKLSDYRKHGGTGLGLAIVSKLAQAMGGKVKVDSEVGKGSIFEAIIVVKVVESPANVAAPLSRTLPPSAVHAMAKNCTSAPSPSAQSSAGVEMPPLSIKEQLSGPPPPKASPAPTRGKEKPVKFPDGLDNVLVVDDNDMNRKILKRMLDQMNLPHLEASNGQETVDVMLSTRNRTGNVEDPCVGMILMDLSMPVMDGLEATMVIRRYAEFADLPIVALTAAAVADGRENCEQAGMTEYQTKPIKRDHLRKICERYLTSEGPPQANFRGSPPNIEDLLV